MEAFPTYDFSQSPSALETNLISYSGKVENSVTNEAFLGTMGSGLEMTPQVKSSHGYSHQIPLDPIFSLEGSNYQYSDLEFTSPDTSFRQDILGAQDDENYLDGGAAFIPIGSQIPALDHPVHWSVERDRTGVGMGIQHCEGSFPANEENSAIYPSGGDVSFAASTSQLVPAVLPTGGNRLNSSLLKREWSSMEAVEVPKMAKRMQQRGPLTQSHVDISQRGSYVRKRNASCNIPAGRNIKNIDELISQSTDELEIKELKQQKRLLRNRQAALDSRQRKKQYTEQLEVEKKKLTAIASQQQDDLNHAEIRINDFVQKEAYWRHKYETLQLEREQILCQHKTECSELRDQISALVGRRKFLAMDKISALPSDSSMIPNFLDTKVTTTKEV